MASSDSLEADLDAIAAPQATSSDNSLEDDLNAISPSAKPPTQSPPGVLGTIGKYAGLADRGLIQGLTAIPSIVGDPLVRGYNAIAPSIGLPKSPMDVSQAVNAGMNKLQLDQPQNLGQSLLTGGMSMLASMAVPIPFLDDLQPGTSQKLLNNAWARGMGENKNAITPDVLQSTADRTGAVFESVRDATPRTINLPQVNSFLTGIDDEFKGLIGNGTADVTDHPLVQKFMQFATEPSGTVTGEQMGKLSSQLGRAATKQFTSPAGDPDLGFALSKVKEAADDIVQQGLSPEQSAAYSTARGQYRTMMQLLGSRALNVDTGDVSASGMGSFLQRTDRSGYAMGNNTADHYAVTHALREETAPSTILGMAEKFQPAGVPLGPVLAGAYKRGMFPAAVKGAAGAYEGLSQEPQ